ncbi:Uncharacterised protein [Bordetella parapertussis]|nr:Uncharacterised protein [Bordetella parapertussis]SUV53634.1 Uncharacterised protein [Bordetella parapertussis]SUV73745.1 integral membrane protein [Bordetella parapertussis]VEF50813.1 Uncharacterised protein [Bordetella parapertussis]VTR24689.1 Uncharacterised protein [Bordetella parapertussis]
MQSDVVLGAAHWVYLLSVVAIILTMVLRANVVVPSVLGTFLVVLAFTGSPIQALVGIFTASFVAAKELFNIFLVITFMTALLNALKVLQADVRMVQPLRRVMTNGHASFLILAGCTYGLSLFFWPPPAVPLVCAILLPAAVAAGLPPLAGAAVSAAVVADRALVLSVITGAIALVMTYLFMRKHIVPGDTALLAAWQARAQDGELERIEGSGSFDKAELARGASQPVKGGAEARLAGWSRAFALITPIAFLGVIALMALPRLVPGLPALRGGDAAALVGGVAFMLMMLATLAAEGPRRMLDVCPEHVTDGFVFAFRAMGSVLPIAGFFFIGAAETAAPILGLESGHAPGLLFDLISAAQHLIPENHYLVAFGVLLVGMVTGIDGSGFAGLPLTGTLSGALGPVVGIDPATLAAGARWAPYGPAAAR